jgi:hypothetical protein
MIVRFLGALILFTGTAVWVSSVSEPAPAPPRQAKLPLYFIGNHGQVDARISYYVQGRNAAVYFTPASVFFALKSNSQRAWVQLELLAANPHPRISSEGQTTALVSYFHGPREQWKTGLPTYSGITYHDVWPGIDLEFTGPDGFLKYNFHLRPGADPRHIRLAYRGASSVSLTAEGGVHVTTPAGSFSDEKPVAWQDTPRGSQPVDIAFRLDHDEVYFEVGAYDPRLPLTIDPVVSLYAGYIGGSAADEGRAIAVDAVGNAFVTGSTLSTEVTLPVSGGLDLTYNGGGDVFIAKVKPNGTSLLFLGYLGGSGEDRGLAIALDSAGNAYVAGDTSSTEATFPVTAGPDLTYNGGSTDAFVAKINAFGTALLYAGFVGGSGSDSASGVAVDQAGNAYLTGDTSSTEATFPAVGGPSLTFSGVSDAFVSKVNPLGTGLIYSGYVGGIGGDYALAIAVDSSGNAYIAGHTNSTQATFPVTAGPDLTYNGAYDGFVAKVNSSGSSLLYCGYVGGNAADAVTSIAVDAAGNAYITGITGSDQTSFPVITGPDLTFNGSFDAFVAKLNPSGAAFIYAGYVGGSGDDGGQGIAVDPAGNAYLTGYTGSTQASFPVTLGPDLTFNGSLDAFIAKINAAGTAFVSAGYVGGSGDDYGSGVAVDQAGNAYLTGYTTSTQASFPISVGPDLTHNGDRDAFVAKFRAFPSTAAPLMALRNGFNAIETGAFPDPSLRNAGGNFRLNPVIALSPFGRAFLIGRDSAVGVWLNVLNPDETYSGWQFAGGNSPGQPALTAAGDTAWIAVRDPWNSYFVRSYSPILGFGFWTWLQGILATDPQIAACSNGDVYITGRDNFNGVWTRRFDALTASWEPWNFIGGIITGTPAITCGSDKAAYIAARDSSNNMWLARVYQESPGSWHYGAGIFQGDLQIAANGNLIHVFGLAANVPWYRTWLVGSGWLGWTSPGGVLTHIAPAIYGNRVFLTGQDTSGNLWWWSSLDNTWRNFGNKNVAPGSSFSAASR